MRRGLLVAMAAWLAEPAVAQTANPNRLRDFCGDRPGLTIAPCTVDPGQLQPDGSGFSFALLPRVTLPVGRESIGAADKSGRGRHRADSRIVGLETEILKDFVLDLEVEALRDGDPGQQRRSATFGAVSLDYTIAERTQLNLSSRTGLNRATLDFELSGGISRKF